MSNASSNHTDRTIQVGIRLSPAEARELDRARGYETKSSYLRRALEAAMEKGRKRRHGPKRRQQSEGCEDQEVYQGD